MSTHEKWYDPYNPAEPGVVPSRRSEPARVLLAEDDPDMNALVSAVLENDGYEVIGTSDGLQMLERLQEAVDYPLTMPDIIVMDVIMPRYSGLGVLSALRRANLLTPVILMSAVADESIRQKARSLGASAFLQKPFDLNDLRNAVVNAALASSRAAERQI